MPSTAFTKSVFILIVTITVVAAFSALAWIVPNLFTMNIDTLKSTRPPLTAVQLTGRDIYIREGCNTCHTQMIRHDQREIARYGPATLPEHDIYEFPQLWGSKRTGPDLFRVGSKYSDGWHATHLMNPGNVVPESTMPAYPWLFETRLDGEDVAAKMRALRSLGVPYSDQQIDDGRIAVRGKTEADAVIAYLQQLGLNRPSPITNSDDEMISKQTSTQPSPDEVTTQ
jgi:cytochrome c oxidase cbb3-type subunit 2